MTQKISILTLTVIAAAAVAAERFITAAGAYPTARQGAYGVTATKADAAGEVLPVDLLGTTVVTAGAAFAIDTPLAVGASGKAVAAETGDVIVARALQAASGDGARVEVFLIPNATPPSGT